MLPSLLTQILFLLLDGICHTLCILQYPLERLSPLLLLVLGLLLSLVRVHLIQHRLQYHPPILLIYLLPQLMTLEHLYRLLEVFTVYGPVEGGIVYFSSLEGHGLFHGLIVAEFVRRISRVVNLHVQRRLDEFQFPRCELV